MQAPSPTPTCFETWNALANQDVIVSEKEYERRQKQKQMNQLARQSRERRLAQLRSNVMDQTFSQLINEPPQQETVSETTHVIPPTPCNPIVSNPIPFSLPVLSIQPPQIEEHFPENEVRQEEAQQHVQAPSPPQHVPSPKIELIPSPRPSPRKQQHISAEDYWEKRGEFIRNQAIKNAGTALVFGTTLVEAFFEFLHLNLQLSGLSERVEESLPAFDAYLQEFISIPWIAETIGHTATGALTLFGTIVWSTHKSNLEKLKSGFRSNRPKQSDTSHTPSSSSHSWNPTMHFGISNPYNESMLKEFQQQKMKEQMEKKLQGEWEKKVQEELDERLEKRLQMELEKRLQTELEKRLQTELEKREKKDELEKREKKDELEKREKKDELEKREELGKKSREELGKKSQEELEKKAEQNYGKTRYETIVSDAQPHEKKTTENQLMHSQILAKASESQAMKIDAVSKTPRPTFATNVTYTPFLSDEQMNKMKLASKLIDPFLNKEEQTPFVLEEPDAIDF